MTISEKCVHLERMARVSYRGLAGRSNGGTRGEGARRRGDSSQHETGGQDHLEKMR